MATQSRLPTGSGVTASWTSSSGTAHLDVDDPIGTPDEDSSFISAAAGASHHFTFTAFAITSSAVAKVSVTGRAKINSGAVTFRPYVVTGTTIRIGATHSPTTSYADFTTDFLTNPAHGGAWTEDEVEGASGTAANNLTAFGPNVTGIAGAEEIRVTQIYSTVDYTAAGGGGAKPWLYRNHTHALGAGFVRGAL